MKSAAEYPEYQVNPDNIQFLSTAAKRLFIPPSSLSAALKEVEDELGIRIFNRGREFIMDQMNIPENRFSSKKDARELCSVSAQHCIFALKAFAKLVKRLSFSE